MNPVLPQEVAERLVSGWDRAVPQRISIGAAGAVIAWLALRLLLRRERGKLAAVLWLGVGLWSVLFAFFAQPCINMIVSTEYMLRVRIICGALSVLVLLITLNSIRRTHLQERYALLWVATALVILVVAVFPHAVDLLRAVTGMEYVSAIVAVTFTFLVLVAFDFSISLSTMQLRETRLAQRIAILEARLRALEGTRDHESRMMKPPTK